LNIAKFSSDQKEKLADAADFSRGLESKPRDLGSDRGYRVAFLTLLLVVLA